MIFVTLSNGQYADKWLSSALELPVPDGAPKRLRWLQWCGQNKGADDHLVGVGTQVWAREKAAHMHFDRVGLIKEITVIRPNDPTRRGDSCATYRVLVELASEPLRIERGANDKHTHWAVLRHLGLQHAGSAHFPRGIYAAAPA